MKEPYYQYLIRSRSHLIKRLRWLNNDCAFSLFAGSDGMDYMFHPVVVARARIIKASRIKWGISKGGKELKQYPPCYPHTLI